MSTTIAEFIEQAWNDHVTDLAGTAARIEPELSQVADARDQVGAFAQLAEHVWVAHLGDADTMERAAMTLAGFAADDAARTAVARARLAASLLRDADAVPSADLSRGAVIRAHGSAV